MDNFLIQWERSFGPLVHRILCLQKQKQVEDEKLTNNSINGRQHSAEIKLINADMALVGYTLANFLEAYHAELENEESIKAMGR
jgi:hypothetical protein